MSPPFDLNKREPTHTIAVVRVDYAFSISLFLAMIAGMCFALVITTGVGFTEIASRIDAAAAASAPCIGEQVNP